MKLTWHDAADSDISLLAEWNHQLIRDEGHRNAMTVEQLADRMRTFLREGYRAVLFCHQEPLGYALFRRDSDAIYLRQFFVRRDQRRRGIGRASFAILRRDIWPNDIRLTVDVLSHNESAIAFWRGVGYRDYCLTMEIMP